METQMKRYQKQLFRSKSSPSVRKELVAEKEDKKIEQKWSFSFFVAFQKDFQFSDSDFKQWKFQKLIKLT